MGFEVTSPFIQFAYRACFEGQCIGRRARFGLHSNDKQSRESSDPDRPGSYKYPRKSPFKANLDDSVTAFYDLDCSPYQFPAWGPAVFGRLDKYTSTIGGIEIIVGFRGHPALQEQFADYVFSVFSYLTDTVGPLNNPPHSSQTIKYLYAYFEEAERIVHSGDHIYGQFTTINQNSQGTFRSDNRLRMDAHIIAHTWFAHFGLKTRAINVYEPSEEGVIQFYAVKSLESTGIWTPDEINGELLSWYNDYQALILGSPYDVPIYPATGWVDFPEIIAHAMGYSKLPLVYRLLDWQITSVTQGAKSLDDVWRFAHDYFPGRFFCHSSNIPNDEKLSHDELLSICNYVSKHDFKGFFQKFISGHDPLPYDVEDGRLKIDPARLPHAEPLSIFQLFRLRSEFTNTGPDADLDSLSDEFEVHVGLDKTSADSDNDRLSDREELGVIVDGTSGEKVGSPLLTDAAGDSLIEVSGTDIVALHSNLYRDENGTDQLYIVLKVSDNQFNPDIWYEVYIDTTDSVYQYRFDTYESFLFDQNGLSLLDPESPAVFAEFRDFLEVVIPLELLNFPNSIFLRAVTRDYYNPSPPDWVDETLWSARPIQPVIFITNPLKNDTDFGGECDGSEIESGRNPLDPDDDISNYLIADLDQDHDVDGKDVAMFIATPGAVPIDIFADNFGKMGCR